MTVAVLAGGFGGGWLVATRVLFPQPPPPGGFHEVPDVYGIDLAEASRRIEGAGLALGVVDPYRHPLADSGRVVGQDPLPGQLAEPGHAVRISVSLGVERRPVPDVTQLRGDRARVILEAAGFMVLEDSIESDEPRGRVVAVEPEAGTQLPMPGEVRLHVSEGPPQVVMPFVVGMSEEEAREVLEALGLLVSRTEQIQPGSEEGLVVQQVPSADQPLERGSAVRIVVAGGGLAPGPAGESAGSLLPDGGNKQGFRP